MLGFLAVSYVSVFANADAGSLSVQNCQGVAKTLRERLILEVCWLPLFDITRSGIN